MSNEESRNDTIRLTEYQALRAEILNRFASQRQYLSLAIIAAGTLFVASAQSKDATVGALLILGYPVLSLFLAAGWGHHDRRVQQIGLYIRDHIEEALGKDSDDNYRMGWEHYPLGPALEYFTIWGIFVGTEVFALLLGASLAKLNQLADAVFTGTTLPDLDPKVGVLLIIAAACVPLTFMVSPPRGFRRAKGPRGSKGRKKS